MRRPSVRADFSHVRFVRAGLHIARTRGLFEVSFGSVAITSRAPTSSVNRRFETLLSLRMAATEEWLAPFERLAHPAPPPGFEGLWELVRRWLVAQAKYSFPIELLRTPPPGAPDPRGWELLRAPVKKCLERWRRLLELQAERIPSQDWSKNTNAAGLVDALFVATVGVAATVPVLGAAAAIESAATSCWTLLRGAWAFSDVESPPAPAVTHLAEELKRVAIEVPATMRIDEDAATSAAIKIRRGTPGRGPSARREATRPAPTTWDEFLEEAKSELAKHRAKHPTDFPERALEPLGPRPLTARQRAEAAARNATHAPPRGDGTDPPRGDPGSHRGGCDGPPQSAERAALPAESTDVLRRAMPTRAPESSEVVERTQPLARAAESPAFNPRAPPMASEAGLAEAASNGLQLGPPSPDGDAPELSG